MRIGLATALAAIAWIPLGPATAAVCTHQPPGAGEGAKTAEEVLQRRVDELLAKGPPALPTGLERRDPVAELTAEEQLRQLLASAPMTRVQDGQPSPVRLVETEIDRDQ